LQGFLDGLGYCRFVESFSVAQRPDPAAVGHRLGVSGAIGRGRLKSTESIPYAGHRSYIDLAKCVSARDLGWIMGANPIPIVAPCRRVTRGVEVPTTFAGGSERRHWLESHETTANEALPR
jgi:hypothetical protein